MSNAALTITVPVAFEEGLRGALAGYAFATPPRVQILADQSDAEVAAMLAESDVLVSASFKGAWGSNGDPTRLRVVHSPGAGVDGIDLPALPPDCTVCNVYGHERGVAEHAFLMMMALQQGLFQLDAALRKGDWTPAIPYLPEMRNRHLLILGLGHIGVELARWGRFLNMQVTALSRTVSPDRGKSLDLHAIGGLDELDQWLGEADFVVIAIPSTPQTKGLIGAPQLARMKSSSFLINVGRAPVVDEESLYQALKERQIAGAGLGVWYTYPKTLGQNMLPSQFPFHKLDNIIMTPHKPTIETMAYRWDKIAQNIHRFSRGEPLENVVCTTSW